LLSNFIASIKLFADGTSMSVFVSVRASASALFAPIGRRARLLELKQQQLQQIMQTAN